MPYMLMIIEPPEQRRTRTEVEGRELYERMLRFGDGLKQRGLLLATESLESQTGAARVEVRDGRTHVLDGPLLPLRTPCLRLLARDRAAEA